MKLNFFMCLVALFLAVAGKAQDATFLGKVTDKKGEALAGANVYLEELEKGTATDFNGIFKFSNLKTGEYTLLVSFIGFELLTQKIQLKPGENKLDFVLEAKEVVLEGLIVTAQKREQSIKEIPTALTSLDAIFLDKVGITELDNLSEYVPGMQIQLQSPNNPGFVIRGITSDNGAANVEPRVSVFQDGVSISKSRGSVIEVYDMERVEVLKGPQGTLFGRGAQIGAIHFIQNKAKNKTEGGFTAGYGNYAYTHLQGYFNTPVVKDKLFVRAAGIYKKRDGYIENLSGGDLNGKDTKAFRGSIKFKPTSMTNIDVIYNYQKDTPPGTSFKSGTYAPVGGDTNPWTFADMEAGEELGLDRLVWGTSLIARHSFSEKFSLTSTTAYREFDSYEKFDADGTVAPALLMAEKAFGKQFSEEIRANFKINDKFEGFAGASYFFEDGYTNVPLWTNEKSLAVLMSNLSALTTTVNSGVLDPINSALSVYGLPDMEMGATPMLTEGVPNYVSNLAGLVSNSNNLAYIASAYPAIYYMFMRDLEESHTESYTNYGKNSAYEFFVDGTYHINNKFSLTAGLRLTFEDIESGYQVDGDGLGTLGFARNSGTNDIWMETDGKLTAGDNYVSMVGRLASNYSITENNDLYINFSRGRRPNVIQFNMVANNEGTYSSSYEVEELNDEIVWSYELGTKGLNPAGNLYYDLAAFYYDYSDFQTSAVNENLQYVTKDAGNATAIGFEASLKYQVNKMLNLFGNYAFIDASFDDKDADGNEQEYAGNTFRLTPKHSFAIGCNLTVPFNDKMNVFFLPTYSYRSKVYFEEDNTEDISQDAFGLLNFRAGINIQKCTLDLFVTNAFDEEYVIDAGNTGGSFGIPTYIAGPPRFMGAEISYRF